MAEQPDGGPPFFDVIRTLRACRAFRDDPIPDEILLDVLHAVTCAPSAENSQPWELVVVRDAGQRAAIADITALLWQRGARAHAVTRLSRALLTDVERGATGGLGQAPVIVVVCADIRRVHADALAASIYPAVQNLLLAAHARGLGSVLTTLPTRGWALAGVLDLPAHVRPVAVVPLGWPARRLGLPQRDPVEAHLHVDRYGRRWDDA